ncbi:unnamed protein product [Vitrella brassicaformis CCMP3155]|uniref:Guanine nucleotide-binding protein subunit beta-like protein n=1 Tax=Vitrella brassicaformis (strain CCMP3155) TaxID=1169540 RepID=A0A0G4GDW9_VITBC|nr:unnamed protein product [Vitrella brassicaformis CCMP3155]|eukprot:CEM27564.1 unnamed protein product [Vitrella brassicaformis CCMP3155]
MFSRPPSAKPKLYKEKLRGHRHAVVYLSKPDGAEGPFLLSMAADGTLRLWNLPKKTMAKKLDLSLLPDEEGEEAGRPMAAAAVTIGAKRRSHLCVLSYQLTFALQRAFGGTSEGTIIQWNLESGAFIGEYGGHTSGDAVTALEIIEPDSSKAGVEGPNKGKISSLLKTKGRLVSGSLDGCVRLWDLDVKLRPQTTDAARPPQPETQGADEEEMGEEAPQAASAAGDSSVALSEALDVTPVCTHVLRLATPVSVVTFSPSPGTWLGQGPRGVLMVGCWDGCLRAIDLGGLTCKVTRSLVAAPFGPEPFLPHPPTTPLTYNVVSDIGEAAVTSLWVFDENAPPSDGVSPAPTSPRQAAASPSGLDRGFAGLSDGRICKWVLVDPSLTGKEAAKVAAALEGFEHSWQAHSDAVTHLVVYGREIYSASEDGTIKVWDTKSRRLLDDLHGHDGGILRMAFSDTLLYTASRDASIRSWDLEEMKMRIREREECRENELFSRRREIIDELESK